MNQQMSHCPATQAIRIMDSAKDEYSQRLQGVSSNNTCSQTIQPMKQITDDFANNKQHHATALLHQIGRAHV